MEILLKVVLIVHIACGFTALLSGLVSLMAKKGNRLHRRAGLVFYYCMLGVAFSAFFISLAKDNRFLLHIGIFSFYQVVAGYRAVKDKSLRPGAFDWGLLTVAAINGVLMIWSLDLVLMVFGAINSLQVTGHLRVSILIVKGREAGRLEWLKRHIGMMMGAFIATITAFLVVNMNNVQGIPAWLGWLLPSLILSPLIAYYTRKYTGGKKAKVA